MLETKEVSELTTKSAFNKLMGLTAKDLPKEDAKAEGYIVTFGEFVTWLPKEAYEVSAVPSVLIDAALNPSIYAKLSPAKKKSLMKLVREAL